GDAGGLRGKGVRDQAADAGEPAPPAVRGRDPGDLSSRVLNAAEYKAVFTTETQRAQSGPEPENREELTSLSFSVFCLLFDLCVFVVNPASLASLRVLCFGRTRFAPRRNRPVADPDREPAARAAARPAGGRRRGSARRRRADARALLLRPHLPPAR